MYPTRSRLLLAIAAPILILTAGCHKKTVASTPPHTPVSAAVPHTTSAPSTSTAAPARETRMASTNRSPRMPDAKTRGRIDQLTAKIGDAYFDYNKASLRPDAARALQADATELRDILRDYPDYKLTIEGHCDERGSDEYNLALGDRRAVAARTYLSDIGISSAQLGVVSYGKEKPLCTEHDAACWQKNRRIHIVAAPRA